MRVFISWSGDRSHRIARAVHAWVGAAFPALDPWLSSDMEKGMSWATNLLESLTTSTVGILCLTAEAKHDWMAFEAGGLLDGSGESESVIALLADPEPEQLARSPIGQLSAVVADGDGLRELARFLGGRAGRPVADERAGELAATLLAEVAAVGTAGVREFELCLVLPEGSHQQPFTPLRDMEWPAAINGIVDALRRQLKLPIAEHDFSTFSYLDLRKAEWLPVPRRISAIATDQLAVVHPSLVEGWYGNASIATELLKSSFQLDAVMKARDRRERIWRDSAFLFAYYVLQLPNPCLRQAEIARLLRQIQELPGLPRSWKLNATMGFLTQPDMNRLLKDMGDVPHPLVPVVELGFSFASIRDAISFLGASVTVEQLRRVLTQFATELEELAPPEDVRRSFLDPIDRISRSERREELIELWPALEGSLLGLLHWLHQEA